MTPAVTDEGTSNLFEAVYYPNPVPDSLASLTILALVFDRLYFPGVYIPEAGVDLAATRSEIERIRHLGRAKPDDVLLLNAMEWVIHAAPLRDFLVFTGKYGYLGTLERGAEELARELEILIFGVPPPNFIPLITSGYSKSLPGDPGASVNFPSWLTYPASALIYSAKHDLVLVNDKPEMPVPALGGIDLKDNARVLSTVLALESVRLVLPPLRALAPVEIAELRDISRGHLVPFRAAMLRLTKELNSAISATATIEEVRKHAEFLARTTVLPELMELRVFLEHPSRSGYVIAKEAVRSLPELVANFLQMDPLSASGRVLAKLAELLLDFRENRSRREEGLKRSGYYYLVKIGEHLSK
ncbi:hypothetical protein [Candidatus Binatus sp.]|uniref:hypothetical protein n=1 Tax=Candidatus Binatus sp. TaxID=2811406 RepID=UPI003F979A3F